MAHAVRLPASCYTGRRSKADLLSGIKHQDEIVSSKVIARNTVEWLGKGGTRYVRYHDTNVAIFFPEELGGQIYLNSNGFNTLTTRGRINEALQKAEIKAYMFQRNNLVWFADAAGKVVEFNNFLALDSEGRIT